MFTENLVIKSAIQVCGQFIYILKESSEKILKGTAVFQHYIKSNVSNLTM